MIHVVLRICFAQARHPAPDQTPDQQAEAEVWPELRGGGIEASKFEGETVSGNLATCLA